MTLEILLQEKAEVEVKVNSALDKVKEWFERTAQSIGEKFVSIKNSISDKLGDFRDYLEKLGVLTEKVPVDIEFDKYNAKAFKPLKGRLTLKEILNEVVSIFKEVIMLFKKDCMSVIDLCKYAIGEILRMKNRRNDRNAVTQGYLKLSKSRKETILRKEQVTTGSESIELNLSKLRRIKSITREGIESLAKGNKEANKETNKDLKAGMKIANKVNNHAAAGIGIVSKDGGKLAKSYAKSDELAMKMRAKANIAKRKADSEKLATTTKKIASKFD